MQRNVRDYTFTTAGGEQLTNELSEAIFKALQDNKIGGFNSYSPNSNVLLIGAQHGNDVPTVHAYGSIPGSEGFTTISLDKILKQSIEGAFRKAGIDLTINKIK